MYNNGSNVLILLQKEKMIKLTYYLLDNTIANKEFNWTNWT